jgi:hypothetical protein
MEVSGQLHVVAALPPVLIVYEGGCRAILDMMIPSGVLTPAVQVYSLYCTGESGAEF